MKFRPFTYLALALLTSLAHAEPKTTPDREEAFAENPHESVYFLKRCGDTMYFTTREYQPLSNWRPQDTTLYVVDAKSGKQLRTIDTDYAIDHHIQPQGKLAIVRERSGLKLYDLESGQVVRTLTEVDEATSGWGDWSPDGKKVLFDGEYPSIQKVYDVETGAIETLRENRFAQIYGENWSADGKRMMFFEVPLNPFGATYRTIKMLDVDPASKTYKEVLQEIAIPRKLMTEIHQLEWKDPGVAVAWQREGGADGKYKEVVVEMPSGKVLGSGSAKDESADDTDEPWVYAKVDSGKRGTFQQIFGRLHPTRNEPLPMSPGQARERWSAQHRRLGDFVLWSGYRADFKYLVTDLQGNVLVKLSDEYFGHADVQGKTLRIFLGTGMRHEYDL